MKNSKKKISAIIDISQAAYKGTGVGRFTTGLCLALLKFSKRINWKFFFSSFRLKIPAKLSNRLKKEQVHQLKLPPLFLELLWNKLHFFNIENFVGQTNWWISSDWIEPPSKKAKNYNICQYKFLVSYL